MRIAIHLYVDDFEICNNLGTSRKKHNLCGVYWVLGNVPPGSHSTLASIYLAVLCKTDDVKAYGYEKVLQPILQDLCILENHGVFISQLGQFAKGSVQYVIADNLAAHGISGFEGVVPVELARCISLLISKKYFTLTDLNILIQTFPYK